MPKGILFAFMAALSWGCSIVMSKKGLEDMDADTLFFFQVGAATLLAWVVIGLTRKKLPLTKKSMLAYSTGIFEPFLAYMLTLYGLKFVSAGIASVIFSLESVFIMILSIIVLGMKTRHPARLILLLLGAMSGSLMSIFPDISEDRGSFTGYLLVLGGVLSAAFYVVISSKLIDSFDPINLLTGQLTFTLILSSVFLFITDSSLHLSMASIFLVISSGVLQYFLAFYFYLHSLRWIQVHIAGVMLYFIPLVAILLSWFFLGEKISIIQAIGIMMTIVCVYVLNRSYNHLDNER